MNRRLAEQHQAEYEAKARHQPPPAMKPLKVLLVEIRDGDDLNPKVEQDDLEQQSGGDHPPAPWWTLDQLLSPVEGLWNAGHVSVTRRNRRELCVLQTAFQHELIMHHVVFAIPQQQDGKHHYKPAPLSWKLTASQLAYISSVVHGKESDRAVMDAIGWVAKAEVSTPNSGVCTVSTELKP